MTSDRPGTSERTGRRGRIRTIAVLVPVLGLTGWAAAEALDPGSEHMPPSAQIGVSPGAPLAGSAYASPQPTRPAPAKPAPAKPGPAKPGSTPAPAPSIRPVEGAEAATPPKIPGPAIPGPATPSPGNPTPAAPGTPASAPPGPDAFAPPRAVGAIDEPPPVAAAKGFGEAADLARGVSAEVTALQSVEGEARGIGEVGGPAVRVTLEVTNSTGEPISLAEAVVNAETVADRAPAEQLSGPGAIPFPVQVGPGQTVSGVVVFRISAEHRDAVRVLFHYRAVSTVAVFEGSVPVQGEAP